MWLQIPVVNRLIAPAADKEDERSVRAVGWWPNWQGSGGGMVGGGGGSAGVGYRALCHATIST
jgi:hypothetical protein